MKIKTLEDEKEGSSKCFKLTKKLIHILATWYSHLCNSF